MNDILKDLFLIHPFHPSKIHQVAIGEKNVAIMISNGSIGVCSTLGTLIEQSANSILSNPDFFNLKHRIVVNAWVNAHCNYESPISGKLDISDAIDFSTSENIVMVGYFGSLAQKLEQKKVKITIFDLNEEDKPVEPISLQKEALKNSNCLILTATSIFNLTYLDLLSYVPSNCEVYILGPSTPLSPLLFSKFNVAGLFGARFNPFDFDVLNSISEGGGTRSFLNRMEKVFMVNEVDYH